MKKKLLTLCILMLVMMNCSIFFASADNIVNDDIIVTFDASSNKFKANDEFGLFNKCKNLMPGDSVSQTVILNVKNIKDQKVTISLQSDDTDTNYDKLMQQFIYIVKKSDGTNIVNKMSDGIILGAYKNDNKEKLEIEIEIPTSVGNELQGLKTDMVWTFTATTSSISSSSTEEVNQTPEPNPGKHENPKTGDELNNILNKFLVLILILCILIGFCFIKKYTLRKIKY